MDVATGYIGLTDSDWYSFLRGHPRVDEANFWQPHGRRTFRALTPGDLFFFKLRAPLKAIAGFGFFERFESLPAWLAWDCFGDMNGAPDFESMIDRISRLRGDDRQSDRAGDFQIGCIMISAPVFFAESEWVAPPSAATFGSRAVQPGSSRRVRWRLRRNARAFGASLGGRPHHALRTRRRASSRQWPTASPRSTSSL